MSTARTIYCTYLKRSLDVVGGLLVLLIIWPILLVLATAVRLTIGSPVLFRQTRPGLLGKPFTIYKFRTMSEQRDAGGRLLPDLERLTRTGRVMRSLSLDELPELYNVIKGEMSFVGPRPLMMQYLPRYSPLQARRNEVVPGITGWAQINGRNGLTWEEKFDLDVWYVDHQSFALDMRIVFMTFWKVLKREGISIEGFAGAPEFMGTPTTNNADSQEQGANK